MPARDFGHGPSATVNKPTKGKTKISARSSHSALKVDYDSIIYGKDTLTIDITMNVRKGITMTGFLLCVDSESGAIAPGEWTKKYGLSMPFEIQSLAYTNQLNKHLVIIDQNLNKDRVTSHASVKLLPDQVHNQMVGVTIFADKNETLEAFEISFKVTLRLREKDEIPVFKRIKEK